MTIESIEMISFLLYLNFNLHLFNITKTWKYWTWASELNICVDLYALHISLADGFDDDVELCSVWYICVEDA